MLTIKFTIKASPPATFPMNRLPPAILFDLDDTIVAYDAAAEGCWLAACRQFAHRLPGVDLDALQVAIRQQSDWFWSDAERFR